MSTETELEIEIEIEIEHDADFVDTSNVPPTLLVEVWTPPGRESLVRAIAVPPALVAKVLT